MSIDNNKNKKDTSNNNSFSFQSDNNNLGGSERVVLPLPPQGDGDLRFEMEIYARFMRHLRHVPNSRMEIKILSALQFTADLLDVSDALVAKTLVDMGMKAPRKAFPITFLDFVDKSMMRAQWDNGAPAASIIKLIDHWNKIGENRFTSVTRTEYAIFNESSYITA